MSEAGSFAAAPVAKLIDEFHRLPGIGPKTAQRLAYYILRVDAEDAASLRGTIQALATGVAR